MGEVTCASPLVKKSEDVHCTNGICDEAQCCRAAYTCGEVICTSPLVKQSEDVHCTNGICDEDQCCKEEETCFPAEAALSIQGRSDVQVDQLEPGMQVLTEDTFEPILGMLHMQTDVVSASPSAMATFTS